MLNDNITVSLRSLKSKLKEHYGLSITKVTLWKTLRQQGFRYGKVGQTKTALLERKDIAERRFQFLRSIKETREREKTIVYLDETWIDTHTYPGTQWLPPSGETGRKLPASRGQRFVILHCGSEKIGFLPGCDLVFASKSNDGRDYHSEMNGRIFFQWVQDKLIPALPSESVIVMDNASYHSVQVEGTRTPTSATKKGRHTGVAETERSCVQHKPHQTSPV